MISSQATDDRAISGSAVVKGEKALVSSNSRIHWHQPNVNPENTFDFKVVTLL